MNVVVIGTGAIGQAVAEGLKLAGYDVVATEKREERRKELETRGIAVTDDNRKATKTADTVILCVKPKDVPEVLKEIRHDIKDKLIISMAAAMKLAVLRKALPEAKFIRAMPNISILVRESFTAYCAASNVNNAEKEQALRILKSLGRAVEIEESYMDAITALSGCAPAYLSVILEAMTYAGLEVGLTKNMALEASAQAMVGTGKLVLQSQKAPHEIRDLVTTPGGVTIEGLQELEKVPIRHAFMSAIKAADAKSKKISEGFSEKES